MNTEVMERFFARLAESPEMRSELAELALRHGIDFSAGELSIDELGAVAGGTEMASLDLQNQRQTQQQVMQTMSNVSKMMHDTTMSIIRNMGG